VKLVSNALKSIEFSQNVRKVLKKKTIHFLKFYSLPLMTARQMFFHFVIQE